MKNEVKIGITITIAILLLIIMMIILKNVSLHERGYHILIHVDNATGVIKGDPVLIAGVEVGRVEAISLKNTDVYMRIYVNEKYRLPKDSRAFIKTLSMMGEKYVEIQPGIVEQILSENDQIEGYAIGDLTDLSANMEPILISISKLLQQLKTVLNDSAKNNIQQTLQNLNSVTFHLNQMIAESQGNFSVTAENLQKFSSNLKNLTTMDQQKVDSLGVNMFTSSKNLSIITDRLSKAANHLEAITHQVESHQGTLGRLVYEDGLYQHLDTLAISINDLVQDIKKNPGRYLKFSVF